MGVMKGSRNQRGFLLPLTLIVLAAGSVIVIAMLSFTSATARSSGQFSDEVPDRFTAEAGMTDILADLIRGSDILDLGYTPPGTLVNEKEVVFDISLAPTSTAPASLYQYVDPGVGFALKSVSSQTSTYFRLDSVQPGSHIRVNWSFTPSNQRWKVKVYDGGGPPSAPAPVILAADDFESGNFSGGSGWLGAWTTSGDATVVSSGGPHGGTYHAQLQRGTGVMTRSVNLSGQSDVRWRFWAKA
ncbi:MAG: hypothetical protein FJ317_00660, partial [SAR202 cluster bacterium]|nr:hypothetical protein [SAR202 cluster bacterium]